MEIRELLQTEIWSKRTSRKILIGIGVLFVGFVLWCAVYVVDKRWMTPGEHTAVRAALTQIDALQNFDGMSDAEFDSGVLLAKRKVEDAEQAAWTSRDNWAVVAVSLYFTETKDLRDKIKGAQNLNAPADKKEKLLRVLESSRNSQKQFGVLLHMLLNQ